MSKDDKYVLNFGDKGETKKVIGLEAKCWSCGALWNISLLSPDATDIKCTCGGHVVSPSGKAMTRLVLEGDEITSPLLEADNKPEIILPDEPEIAPKKVDVKQDIVDKMKSQLSGLYKEDEDE